jgi:hypothetical protein
MCFENFIGLTKKCNLDEPTSGLYVDMLEGVSMKSVANIAMGDAITAQALINEKTQLVFEKLESGAYPFLFHNAIEHSIESIISKGFSTEIGTLSENVRGLRIETKRGQLTKLVVERLYLLSSTDADGITITINDGIKTTTKTVSLVGGVENVIELNYSTHSHKVDITYQDHHITPFEGSISPYDRFWPIDCNNCGCNGMRMVGLDSGDEVSNWVGIRADTSLQCDRKKMVCLIAERSKVAILYLVGSELMKEHGATDRVNFLSINGKEFAQTKAAEWREAGEDMLMRSAQGITDYLRKSQSNCFICNNVKYGYSLP